MPPSVDPTALRQRLESLARAGVQHLPRSAVRTAAVATREPAGAAALPPSVPIDMPRRTSPPALFAATDIPSAVIPSTAASLPLLADEVAGCTRCTELASTRTQTVFGVGNPQARLCLLGEAPGADEDRTGIPFVGRAGQLLTKIIEACKLTRDEVYILNVLKCRPPGNRNPAPDEARNCRGYLLRQFELIQPEFICCFGSVAAQNLLETTETIGRLRGRLHQWQGKTVVCTYHPAYLLRNPAAKKDTWADMQMLMQAMGISL